jgi:hypothetical protein
MLFRKKAKDEPPGKKLWETYFKELLKKNLQKALDSLKKLKEIEPDNSQVYLKMGDLLQRVGDNSSAVKAYHDAANCLVSEDHQEKAVAIYKIILRIDPENSDAQDKIKEVVAYLESLSGGAAPVVSVGIEEMPVHETEDEAGVTIPAAGTEGVSEDILSSEESVQDTAEVQPEAGSEGISEEVWPSGESEAAADDTQPETETEDLSAEEWMLGEAGEGTSDAQPEAGTGELSAETLITEGAEPESGVALPETSTEGVSEEVWPSGVIEEGTGVSEKEEVALDDEIDSLISQLGVDDLVVESADDHTTILSALGAKETDTLLKKANHRTFTYSEKVVEEGDTGDSMFVIKKGEARVVSNVLGKDIELARLKRGDIFGEMVFLSGRPRTASVIAEGDLEVLEISSELLQDVVENNPEVQDRIAEFFYSRVQDTMKKVKGQ